MNNYNSTEELIHYGVKGMKWGVRRKQYAESEIYSKYKKTKADYKKANREYSKSFNKAHNKAIAAWSPIKKHRQANDKRWDDAVKKAVKSNEAEAAYKDAKRARKSAIKSTTNDLNKKASLGEKLIYNEATRKKAAKYIVDNNMTVAEATKKAKGDAWRNTAAFVAVYGGVLAATVIASKR